MLFLCVTAPAYPCTKIMQPNFYFLFQVERIAEYSRLPTEVCACKENLRGEISRARGLHWNIKSNCEKGVETDARTRYQDEILGTHKETLEKVSGFTCKGVRITRGWSVSVWGLGESGLLACAVRTAFAHFALFKRQN